METLTDSLSLIRPVYRFFQEAEHADLFCHGKVRISTIETCRKYEDKAQGDAEEAHLHYKTGSMVGGSDESAFVTVASRAGIYIGPNCSNITVSNCSRTTSLPDAFVLCTTLKYEPSTMNGSFGEACVKINKPRRFYERVSRRLARTFPIKQGAFGPIVYANRHYEGLQPLPGPIGFVKPPDLYASQCEFRFLWTVNNSIRLDPFLLDVPEIASLCSRVA